MVVRFIFHGWYKKTQRFTTKSPIKFRINDVHLWSVLKVITTSNISPEVEKIIAEKRYQVSGSK